jgi:sulfur-oxidizing protein SoxY
MSMLRRRHLLIGLGGMTAAAALPAVAAPTFPSQDQLPDEFQQAWHEALGEGKPRPGRIFLELPALAESGNAVPLTVRVESPMNEHDFARRLVLFAPFNPHPRLCTLHWTPWSGRAEFTTKIRLARSQEVIAVAELSDGSLWQATQPVTVTIGACESLGFRN